LGKVETSCPRWPARRPGIYELGHDPSVRASDCVCALGVRSPVAHGQLARARISVMLSGAFHARSSSGDLVVGAGALVLGNPADAYEYRHVDDGGDRSVVFDYSAAALDEIAAAVAPRGPDRFLTAAVPASPAGADAVALAEQALRSGDPETVREAALAVAMIAMAAERSRAPALPPSFAQARRVARSLRYIEAHLIDDCSLEALAGDAGLGRYHFLRVFRAMTGQTPRQYVIASRLRAAATTLRTSPTPITRVAIDAGFGDLSHFTTSFARAFGVSPRRYRTRPAPAGHRAVARVTGAR
jgi:AraC-like DNA-binding protein